MTMVDDNFFSSFEERWHPETSSFHLPFAEVSITIDDVSGLLHVPIIGQFYNQTGYFDVDVVVDLS